ncbi:MAG: Gti1/Pac2 family protein [archaeon]|nr:Gti1/Pac2 family protein [archaeon]
MLIDLQKTKIIGLGLALVGLMVLAMVLPEERNLRISEIKQEYIGETIIVVGIIKELEIRNGNVFFFLENESGIKAVYFSPKTEQMLILKENETIKATAQISSYKNELELIIEKVERT